MENSLENLKRQLNKCRNIINNGYTNMQDTGLDWLNEFCLEFLQFSEGLHTFLTLHDKRKNDRNDQVEMIYLCLAQIVTCIKYMENTIKAEKRQGAVILASRQHFLDRIQWCINRLRSCLKCLIQLDNKKSTTISEEKSFVELMDLVFDQLTPYSSYKEESQPSSSKKSSDVAENRAQAIFASQQIRSIVDLVLSHTLAFANVALKQDKRALSALCQKVLRECVAFKDECSAEILCGAPLNDCNRKLKAISLENALYQLEDFINEALLRLIYTCFVDFSKFSIDKLRQVIRERNADDPELDELIADFDVNIDRSAQIGIFAIAFSPNVKIRTIVRSCLASFECLDSCIIPSLQSKGTSDIFSKLLEQHFNEEVVNFKTAIQEIIDSQAFASCFHEQLILALKQNDKDYNKDCLENIIKMAEVLYEHFQLPVNHKLLQLNANRTELFKKFFIMLQECQAALKCSNDVKVETQRVLKRFKILRSVLRRLIDELGDKKTIDGCCDANTSQALLPSDELDDSEYMFASIGISPSICSILYNNNKSMTCRKKRRLADDSSKRNYSKLPLVPKQTIDDSINDSTKRPTCKKLLSSSSLQRTSLRRKESLRTAMFKRQKTSEAEKAYNVYKNNSDSLQISEILGQLTGLSSNLLKHIPEKSIISN